MTSPPTVSLDVADLRADAATLDALARFALALRRCGYEIRLRRPSSELLELIEFAGLSSALCREPRTPDGLDSGNCGSFRPDSTEPRC